MFEALFWFVRAGFSKKYLYILFAIQVLFFKDEGKESTLSIFLSVTYKSKFTIKPLSNQNVVYFTQILNSVTTL